MLKLKVKELPEGDTSYNFEVSSVELGFAGKEDIKIVSSVSVLLKIYNVKGRIVVFGSVACKLELICVKCLEPYIYPLALDFEVEYRKRVSIQNDNAYDSDGDLEEKEILDKTGVVVEYSGDTIDISEDIRQNIILALPLKPVCKDNCRGLCPVCGVNLNIEKCSSHNREKIAG